MNLSRFIIITGFIFFALRGAGQESNIPHEIFFSGVVMDGDSLQPLSGCHIIVNGARGTATNESGRFLITVKPADSVMISRVGYMHFLVIIPADFSEKYLEATIKMTKETFQLGEVQIYPWPSKEQFKKEFMELQVEEEKVELNLEEVKEDKSVSNAGAGAISMSSVFKYKRFYKDEIDKGKVQSLASNERYKDYILARFNEAAKKYTPVKEAELEEFREFCNLTEEFIETATDYDMAAKVVQLYRDFSAKN